MHPDYLAGPRNNYAQDLIRDFTFDDTLTWIKSGWGGDHTFKAGVAASRNAALPQGTAANFTGHVRLPDEHPLQCRESEHLSAALPDPHGPVRFRPDRLPGQRIHPGQVAGQRAADAEPRPPLRLAGRSSKTKDAIRSSSRRRLRSVGQRQDRSCAAASARSFSTSRSPSLRRSRSNAVVAPTFLYDTTQVTSPSITGPAAGSPRRSNATACLQPVTAPTAGEAVISPACRSFLVGLRNQVNAGGFVNNQPTVDGDRRMRVHLGVQRRREARAEAEHGGLGRLRRQPRA